MGRQTLARGGSRSTPALVQRAAVSSVWGKAGILLCQYTVLCCAELPGGCTTMPKAVSVPARVTGSKAQSCAAANHLTQGGAQHPLTQAVCYQGSLLIRAMPEPAQPPAGGTGRLPTSTGTPESPALGPHRSLPGRCTLVSSADKTRVCCFKQEGSRAKGWCADPMTRGAGGSCPALVLAKPRARSVLSGFVPAQSLG